MEKEKIENFAGASLVEMNEFYTIYIIIKDFSIWE